MLIPSVCPCSVINSGQTFAKDTVADSRTQVSPRFEMLSLGAAMYLHTGRRKTNTSIETVSKYGAGAFYTGAIANATITALQAQNGTMTLEDLKNYSVAIRKPAQITYRDFRLTACSAPSSGEVALSVMKTVEGYQGFGEEAMLNLSTHRLDEAIRFGYAEVNYLVAPSGWAALADDDLCVASESRRPSFRRRSRRVPGRDAERDNSCEDPQRDI